MTLRYYAFGVRIPKRLWQRLYGGRSWRGASVRRDK